MGRFAKLNRVVIWNKNILFALIITLCPILLTQTVSSQEIKTFTYSYGGRYVGQTKDGMRHGRGTMTWANGDKYVGEFKDDKKSGRGKYIWSNGDTYDGEWKDDKMHGEGMFIYADGQKYEGEFKDDKFDGNGTMTWPDGAKYVGEWKNDRRHGEGTMIWSDETKYMGEWRNDERNGKGVLAFANGDRYEGEFKDDEMHGKGTFTHADGKKYTGGFDEGKFRNGAKPRTPEKLIDRVVAVVNDSVLTLSEVKEAAQSVKQDPEDPEVQSEVLDLLIEETLLQQEAKKRGISVTEEEVDLSIQDIKRRFNLDDQKLNEVLKKQNLTRQAFRDQWKRQILSRKLMGSQVQGQIAVTEDEIQNYYEKNYGKLQSADETRISHILIPVETSEEQAQKLAFEVTELARSGEDFSKLAEKYSKDQISAAKGGDLGYFKKGDLVEALDNAIKDVPTGEIIGPVRSPAGYHVIKITDRKKSEATEIDNHRREEVREEIYKQKVEKALQTWLENIKETAYIERKL